MPMGWLSAPIRGWRARDRRRDEGAGGGGEVKWESCLTGEIFIQHYVAAYDSI